MQDDYVACLVRHFDLMFVVNAPVWSTVERAPQQRGWRGATVRPASVDGVA